MQNQIKTVILCRVSSKEQEETGYSLPAQEKLLNSYSETKGLHVIKPLFPSLQAEKSKEKSSTE